MEKVRRIAVPLAALVWLAVAPAPAAAGYDIAHIVERTCEPGGPLIVTDKYKLPRDRERVLTEPGEVIDCPPAGPKDSFQIAAGPENIGGDPYLCVYFSLFNGDGADICLTTEMDRGGGSSIEPLMTARTDQSGPLELSGILKGDVAAVRVAAAAGSPPDPTVLRIDAERAARLGAAGAFSFFSLTTSRSALCAEKPLRLVGLDRMDRPIDEASVGLATSLLTTDDGVPFDRSLKALCGSEPRSETGTVGWPTALSAMLRSLFGALI